MKTEFRYAGLKSEFSFRIVAQLKLKNPTCPTIYILGNQVICNGNRPK